MITEPSAQTIVIMTVLIAIMAPFGDDYGTDGVGE